MVLSRVRLIRVKLVLVNLNPINDTLVSGLALFGLSVKLSVLSHTPTVQLKNYFSISEQFFYNVPSYFCQHRIHQVIWPSPCTPPCQRLRRKLYQFCAKAYNGECNRCDSKKNLCAFLFNSRTGSIWPANQMSLFTHNPDRLIYNYFSIFVQFFSPNGPSFFPSTIHKVNFLDFFVV